MAEDRVGCCHFTTQTFYLTLVLTPNNMLMKHHETCSIELSCIPPARTAAPQVQGRVRGRGSGGARHTPAPHLELRHLNVDRVIKTVRRQHKEPLMPFTPHLDRDRDTSKEGRMHETRLGQQRRKSEHTHVGHRGCKGDCTSCIKDRKHETL